MAFYSLARPTDVPPFAEALALPDSGRLGLVAASGCALAIASVPIFSTSESFSIIPQALAVLGAGLAALTLLKGIPRLHVSLLVFGTLVLFWGISLLSDSELWIEYQSLLKVCLLAFACHIAFRSRQHLMLLFGVYAATGAVTVALNWHQLQGLGSSMEISQLSEKDRFAGTFENANTAGIYGVMLILSGLIIGFNGKNRARWPLLTIGLLAGLAICFFSGSRKAMLGLGLIIFLIPWMAASGNVKKGRGVFKIIFLLFLSVVLGGLLFSQLPFTDRLLVPFREGVTAESSGATRFAMLVKVLELWGTHPVLGCGFEGFSRLSGFGVYSHTTFGEVLCNGGLLGLGLISVFYLVPLVQLWRLAKDPVCPGRSQISTGLLAFWLLFTLFSCFAVMFDSREFVPIGAAVCGFLQANRSPVSSSRFAPRPKGAPALRMADS